MSDDSELLDLIEYYKWNITFTVDGNVRIIRRECRVNVIEPTLREAIKSALTAQVKWSAG